MTTKEEVKVSTDWYTPDMIEIIKLKVKEDGKVDR